MISDNPFHSLEAAFLNDCPPVFDLFVYSADGNLSLVCFADLKCI